VKWVSLKIQGGHLLWGNLDSCRINVGVQLAANLQTVFGGGGGNQLDDDFVTDERFAAPVLTDEGKQSVLNLVPFASSWWQVTYGDLHSRFIGQLLEFHFPQAHPRSIARQNRR
jgi:hypothetical protein